MRRKWWPGLASILLLLGWQDAALAWRPQDEPPDETEVAAEALRRLLEGKTGKKPSEGPEVEPPAPVTSTQDTPPGEKPPPEPPKEAAVLDEAEAAAEALEQVLPGAQRPADPPPEADPEERRPDGQSAEVLRDWFDLPSRTDTTASSSSAEEGLPIHGYLQTRYWFRRTGNGTDQDLVGLLALDVGDAERHAVTGHILARGSAQLDGNDRDSEFAGITNTYDKDLNGRLYEAYIDVHRVESLPMIRLGRQSMFETPVEAYFDGVRAETRPVGPWKIWLGGFAGVSTHFYESSPDGDFLSGAYLGFKPWQQGRSRFDWMRAEDDTSIGDHTNNMFRLAHWQGLGEHLQLHGHLTWLESRTRDYQLRATTTIPKWGLLVQAEYFELLDTQRLLATEFDPFYAAAGAYQPYRQVRLFGTKDFGEHFGMTVGYDVRELSDDGDEGQFNREYDRIYATPTLHDLLVEGSSLSATVDWWASDGDDITTFGADLAMPVVQDLLASVGSSYSLYKFDALAGRERERVRIYYVGLDYRPRKWLRLRLNYEFEIDDSERYQSLRAGLTWSF